MPLENYRLLALRWQPEQKSDTIFLLVAGITMALMLAFGALLSSMDVPEKSRKIKAEVPERVAKFINKKPKPPKPKPRPKKKPKPKPPEPKVEKPKAEKPPKPKVERVKPKLDKKILTKKQTEAREKVKDLGVFKHLSALNDMIDAPVSDSLKTAISKSDQAKVAVDHDARILTASVSDGSGGVDGSKYAATAGTSSLVAADLAKARAALDAGSSDFTEVKQSAAKTKTRTRSEEEIVLVIDRHKSQLQTLYNRARRKNPSLKGLLVLEITILPSGSVSKVDIKSSELNDRKLERSMMARIKALQFGAKNVDSVTVNYPIEFLPY